jgi:hypothetical protein
MVMTAFPLLVRKDRAEASSDRVHPRPRAVPSDSAAFHKTGKNRISEYGVVKGAPSRKFTEFSGLKTAVDWRTMGPREAGR